VNGKVQTITGHAFLFVYGTLMRGLREDLRTKVDAKLIGGGTISAKLYDLGDYPGAKLAGKLSHSTVKGELYQIRDPDGTMRKLDSYEGCFPSEPGKSLFTRELVTVTLEDGKKTRAWTYLYNRPLDNAKLIPSGNYRDALAAHHRN
jgi:gamma-glutamylcyclotransferase (GGCT)/AIG2-like uncharacterized protein YtfP